MKLPQRKKVSQLPHVTGSGRDPDKVYISNELDQALTAAEKQAQQMKDEYISVEHVFMGMLQRPGRVAGELFKQFGITPEKLHAGVVRRARQPARDHCNPRIHHMTP